MSFSWYYNFIVIPCIIYFHDNFFCCMCMYIHNAQCATLAISVFSFFSMSAFILFGWMAIYHQTMKVKGLLTWQKTTTHTFNACLSVCLCMCARARLRLEIHSMNQNYICRLHGKIFVLNKH